MLCFITVALLASVVQSQTVPAEEVKLDKRKLFGFCKFAIDVTHMEPIS